MVSEKSKRADKTPLGILFSILTSFRVIERFLEIETMKHGTSPTRFAVMSALFRSGGEMTPSEISERVFRAKNSVTSVINTLEKKGAVRRIRSKNDLRSVRIVITDKGWKEANRLTGVNQELSREVLSYLDKEQIEALVDIMRTIRRNLLPRITNTSEKVTHPSYSDTD